MNKTRKIFIAAIALAFASGLAACRDEEQHRPLSLGKSTYHGQTDQKLNEQQLRELKDRMSIQAGGQI